ncbi:acetyl-CoA C-acetyltransferase [Bacillus sp. DX1.1]|uniref:acetyl-CoA C-acetyltransferase n=1 Tax=unclassified Bacillus (in: firmicutes) TaxID=185979 RepID=UPI00257087BA|nr:MULTISPECIES: acetyl-CoA C-acetyltransferase [unclassified Bacillus (in: firmicutes)]MDM5157263.1 acetyl-CoA C-acetyltransferase [Bacillus sp. DX1.1]WJE81490.1 acetyl-CoA C-acetyltransferase [Bacillus sp. DX3.1]
MEEVAIISAVRTPIGKFGGSLKNISAETLGALTVKEAIRRACISTQEVESVIFGNVLQAGLGQNIARQIAVRAGIPYEAPAMTINEVCGSGLKSVILGNQAIQLGEADIVVVGGTENMSQSPYLLPNHRWDHESGDTYMIDSMLHDGLTDAFEQIHMGVTAENLAERFRISREEQDQFALHSQKKAINAKRSNKFKEEIIPVKIKNAMGVESLFSEDEYVRQDTTMEGLQKLKPAFIENGTVTAGNSSGINDCAAALVLMRKSIAEARNIPYLATIKGYIEIGMDPSLMGYAPYYSIRKLIDKTGITLDDIDLFELNEAFASQSIAVIRDLNIDVEKVNVNGGAIALGHPIGASGARILVTLLYEMQKRASHLGLASLCVGGGIGISMLVEH